MRDRSSPLIEADVGSLDWEKMDGLIPALVQDRQTGEVLTLAYMNAEALKATIATGFATFFSRSRRQLWQKGETSGNRMKVDGLFTDCDGDALLVLVEPQGPACHLGTRGCFEAGIAGPGWLARLSAIIQERAASGDSSSYTRRLLEEGPERIGKKIGEEGVEVALAAVNRDVEGCIAETADLVYHLSVLMESRGFGWGEVAAELEARHAKRSNRATTSS